MRKIAVITTFNSEGYNYYAENMIKTFDKHWPEEVDLYAYYEGIKPEHKFSNRVYLLDLIEVCPNLVKFKEKYKDDPIANGLIGESQNGLKRPDTASSKWTGQPSFLWDVVRFSHKSYCQIYATREINADTVFWIDADTLTFRDVSIEELNQLLPDGNYCSFLGRGRKYSECGFIAYNVKHPAHSEFMAEWLYFYDNEIIFSLPEWHDCIVFDTIRQKFIDEKKIIVYNLNENNHKGHPFVNSILGSFMDHLKGKRKITKKSWQKDIQIDRSEDYWK